MTAEIRNKILFEVQESLKVNLQKIEQLLAGIPVETVHVSEVERYISGSGNITWKAFTDDGRVVYLRQQDKEMFRESGLLARLEAMDDYSVEPIDLELDVIRDGDFLKVRVARFVPGVTVVGGDRG